MDSIIPRTRSRSPRPRAALSSPGAACVALSRSRPPLRPLILAFGLKDDDPVGVEVARARAVAYRAALDAIEDDPSEEAEILRLEYRAILMQADDDPHRGLANRE